MGDQLYADVWAPLPHTLPEGLAHKYERYWGDGAYRELLAACPTLVSCDDHEFWNDFPRAAGPGPAELGPLPARDRRRARRALRRLSELAEPRRQALEHDRRRAGQLLHRRHPLAPHPRRRPSRPPDDPGAVGRPRSRGRANLRGPGVLVLPQPLLKAGGSKTDRTLVDFKESDRLGAIFEHALGGPDPHDILILTGDIHTGRLGSAEIVGLARADPRVRRQPRQPRHAVPAAVGPQGRGAAGQADHQPPHLADDRRAGG